MKSKLLIAAGLAACVVACAVGEDDVDESEGAFTDGAPAKKERLDPIDEDGLYHWAEGSEFLPYFAVRALKVLERDPQTLEFTGRETDDFILSKKNLVKYGFIPDEREA